MTIEPPINPYASPEVLEPSNQDSGPSYQLYSIVAITLATFLGSLVAGALLMMLNLCRLGRAGTGWGVLALGVVVTTVVVCAAVVMPGDTPSWPFVLFQTAFTFVLARNLLERPIKAHQLSGGKLASNWWAVGISVVVGALVVVVYLVVLFSMPDSWLDAISRVSA